MRHKIGANYVGSSFVSEFVFLQYFKVIGREDSPVDDNKRTLEFIRLSGARVHAEDSLVHSKFYVYCAIEAMRGTVQLVEMSQHIQ